MGRLENRRITATVIISGTDGHDFFPRLNHCQGFLAQLWVTVPALS
jgi:hypothetical protein